MSYILQGQNGSAAEPTYSFADDPDTGVYRIGANNLGVAVGGAEVADVSSTGVDVTGVVGATGGVRLGSASTPTIKGGAATLADAATDALTAITGGATSGILFVHSPSDGAAAIFLIQGGNNAVNLISDPGSIFSATAATASRINVYYSAGNARYEVENRRGASRVVSGVAVG